MKIINKLAEKRKNMNKLDKITWIFLLFVNIVLIYFNATNNRSLWIRDFLIINSCIIGHFLYEAIIKEKRMRYIFLFIPQDTESPEIVGTLTAKSDKEAESKIEELMPKKLKGKKYHTGVAAFSNENAEWFMKLENREVTLF